VQAGKADEGVKLLRGAVTTLRADRHHLPVTVCLRAIAEDLLQSGDLGEARSVISEAVDIVKARGAAFDLPELLRVKAEVLLSEAQPDLAGAEHLLSEALDCAKTQSALSWELRASTTLARLWIGQGRIEEARTLLAGVYGPFTDGLNTKDLIAARALLDELSSPPQDSVTGTPMRSGAPSCDALYTSLRHTKGGVPSRQGIARSSLKVGEVLPVRHVTLGSCGSSQGLPESAASWRRHWDRGSTRRRGRSDRRGPGISRRTEPYLAASRDFLVVRRCRVHRGDEAQRRGRPPIVTLERGEDGSARDVQRDWRLAVRASRVASVNIEPSEVLSLPCPQ